jgi:N utilization substance protein B
MSTKRPGGLDPTDRVARQRARRRALQALYAWQISNNPIARVLAEFEHEQDMEIADRDFFVDLVRGVERLQDELDAKLEPFLDRPIEQIDPIERAVLRLATYELIHRPDTPYRVALSEAIELAKRFGSEFGHTYVNGVLDKAAAEWRPNEYRQ